jgi:cysteine desulfurase/selenocysteine lyase
VLSSVNANVHRGAYRLSAQATELYDAARVKVARYINAESERSIIFVRGATEGINLVAMGLEHTFSPGDVVLVSLLEHHSNIVPWHMLAHRRGLKVVFTDITPDGRLDMDDFRTKVKALRPKMVAVTQLANSLGTITPIQDLVRIAHGVGAKVLVDGAQGASHLGVDVQDLGCDFYVFSGHKLYGPTGIGVLYGKPQVLEQLKPVMGGGDMISFVSTEGFGYADIPQRFEAGTPAFPEVIALGTAIDFMSSFSRPALKAHEYELVGSALDMLSAHPGVVVHGPGALHGHRSEQIAVVSFSIDGVHPHDFATIADTHGVQIRAGNHCAQPTLRKLGLNSTARMSFGVYSTADDLAAVSSAISEAQRLFQ